jgi:GNAT superfamily N-acetyltransferase
MGELLTIAGQETGQIDAVAEIVARAFAPLRRVYIHQGNPPPIPAISTCLAASLGHEPVATLSYYLDPPFVRLFRIAVAPEYQQRGFARALLQHVEETVARPAGLHLALFTIAETGNVPVFERLGFEPKGETLASGVTGPKGETLREVAMIRHVA